MTYWGLNAIFLAVAVALAVVAQVVVVAGGGHAAALAAPGATAAAPAHPGSRRVGGMLGALLVTAVVLLAMTAVFDNVMIGIGLVGYDRSLISGAFVGIAPLEDFAYALGAVLLLPALWVLLPGRRTERRAERRTITPHEKGHRP